MEGKTVVSGRQNVHGLRVLLDFSGLVARGALAGLVTCLVLVAAVLLFSATASAAVPAEEAPLRIGDAEAAGLLVKTGEPGLYRRLPALATDVDARVSGIVARTRVVQTFRNPGEGWLEGIYVFPLPENAAVDRLKMRIGEREIEGRVQEREAARSNYEQAKREGRRTSLVEQERPNLFTGSVANIGPGESIVIEIEYQQTLRYDQGAFRLRFPMVVGPRYVPGSVHIAGVSGSGWAPATDAVPDAPRITPPVIGPGHEPVNPVALRVELDSGFPLSTLRSAYHPVSVVAGANGTRVVTLDGSAAYADRDFELEWTPAPNRAPQAAVFTERRGSKTYALMMVMPPESGQVEGPRIPREVIFVIDTSGSMMGESIAQAREALLLALDRLADGDRFNIVEFNSRTTALFEAARPADAQSLARARAFVRGLKAQGGTEMADALRFALARGRSPDALRQVIFLTDGAVGNEDQLFGIIRERLGDSRLFTIGIGSAPNGHFMTRAAQFGRGTFTYIGDAGEVRRRMDELFTKLEKPALSDVRIEWPAGTRVETWPQRIPDLYHGEPLVVAAEFEGEAAQAVVTGRRGTENWKAVLPVVNSHAREGIAALWARRKIAALMDDLRTGSSEEVIRGAVVALALEHRLVSRYTSLVAVDVTPARAASMPMHTAAVPTNLPHGWQYGGVFGELPQTATPGPLHILAGALALIVAMVLWLFSRRRVVLRLPRAG
ncbi:MAG: marine proteobacterial sortase target protein, partial [Burkholderiales bacterium]|nr:marine proteobacterial sortase target protein [Burkholderiales bacterium]